MVIKYIISLQQVLFIANKSIDTLETLKDMFVRYKSTKRFVNLYINVGVMIDIVYGIVLRFQEKP